MTKQSYKAKADQCRRSTLGLSRTAENGCCALFQRVTLSLNTLETKKTQ